MCDNRIGTDARTAFCDALAAEMDMDLTPEFMAAADRVLVRLYLHGYIVAAAPEDEEVAEVA